ncbi:hypothetical protein ACG7TL_005870 [Trametes sanguinea]
MVRKWDEARDFTRPAAAPGFPCAPSGTKPFLLAGRAPACMQQQQQRMRLLRWGISISSQQHRRRRTESEEKQKQESELPREASSATGDGDNERGTLEVPDDGSHPRRRLQTCQQLKWHRTSSQESQESLMAAAEHTGGLAGGRAGEWS